MLAVNTRLDRRQRDAEKLTRLQEECRLQWIGHRRLNWNPKRTKTLYMASLQCWRDDCLLAGVDPQEMLDAVAADVDFDRTCKQLQHKLTYWVNLGTELGLAPPKFGGWTRAESRADVRRYRQVIVDNIDALTELGELSGRRPERAHSGRGCMVVSAPAGVAQLVRAHGS